MMTASTAAVRRRHRPAGVGPPRRAWCSTAPPSARPRSPRSPPAASPSPPPLPGPPSPKPLRRPAFIPPGRPAIIAARLTSPPSRGQSMKRTSLFFCIGGLAALLAIAAVCHAYQAATVPASPPCEPTAAPHTKATPCCGKQADPLVSGKPCCQSACCAVAAKAPAAKQPNVYDLLEKLEALKAKQDALESEVRETRALLNEKFRTLQERVGKAGAGLPPHAPPVVTEGGRYYEPITTKRVILVKDPETGAVKRIEQPVTTYVLREVPVPMPAPAPQPVPPHTEAVRPPIAEPTVPSTPLKAPATDGPPSPINEPDPLVQPKKSAPVPSKTPAQKKPSVSDLSDAPSN